MEDKELSGLVKEVALEYAEKGPGWSQQRAVLNEVARRVSAGAGDLRTQQRILTCWHDLFRDGWLSWGYNIDNPDAPFYHLPSRTVASRAGAGIAS